MNFSHLVACGLMITLLSVRTGAKPITQQKDGVRSQILNIWRRYSDRHWLQNLTCYNSTDPHAVNVTNIYNDMVDTGSLWKGEPSDIRLCSNTSPPASSPCVPCVLEQTVHVVCKDLPEKVMEAVGQNIIDFIKADCPTFLEPGLSDDIQEPARCYASPFPSIIFLGIIGFIALGIIIIVIVLVHKRRSVLEFGRKLCRRANPPDTKDRSVWTNLNLKV